MISTHAATENAVAVGASAGVSVAAGMRVSVGKLVCGLIGKNMNGAVGQAGCGSYGGTYNNCTVCRRVELPRQLARWRSATVIP